MASSPAWPSWWKSAILIRPAISSGWPGWPAPLPLKWGLSPKIIEGIRIAGLLHDVGKIRVPVSILNRTGQLLDAEMDVIKIHPQISYEILKDIPFPWPCARIVLQHHERLDGTGYPFGIRGDEILLESRILTVADVTEAKSSFRPYRPAQGLEAALAELREHRGIWYDAAVVDACLAIFAEGDFRFDGTEPPAPPDFGEKLLPLYR